MAVFLPIPLLFTSNSLQLHKHKPTGQDIKTHFSAAKDVLVKGLLYSKPKSATSRTKLEKEVKADLTRNFLLSLSDALVSL